MALTIGGAVMPTPKLGGVTVKQEKIWSKKTGRGNQDGLMLGDIVAIKTTVSIQWGPLTRAERQTIESACASAFFNVSYPEEGVSGTFYAGTPSFTTYSHVQGYKQYSSGQVDLIMQ
ncbi:MAG: hypothetical protein IKE58_10105 [Blautia sp.]|nr:hypothetical protein [Blautia sp.]